MDTPKFVADVHLARLAKGLRLLGIDTLYFSYIEDRDLKIIAQKQRRVILTKDRRLCQESRRCYLVKEMEYFDQILEVMRSFSILRCNPLSRCLMDNTPIRPVAKWMIEDSLPLKVKRAYKEFWICPECQRIYWHGTHWERMREFIREVCDEIREPSGEE
ncbi:MAG: hypothetical protein C6H99_07105 [Epsilonproteobacteria bacterium]|nr:hypothetical protein [Campylobacterota bacterium]NPA64440.1 hypothetical protein [Campylobacterota bacterium]